MLQSEFSILFYLVSKKSSPTLPAEPRKWELASAKGRIGWPSKAVMLGSTADKMVFYVCSQPALTQLAVKGVVWAAVTLFCVPRGSK